MEFGFNINGVGTRESVISACRSAEESGFSSLWVGESRGFASPFTLMPMVAHNTGEVMVGSGTISTLLHNPHHIERAFENMVATYGSRFACGLSTGDPRNLRDAGVELRNVQDSVRRCVEHLRRSKHTNRLPLYVGAAGPKMLRLAASISDGVLANYVNPQLMEWARERARGSRRLYAYGPALVLPEESLLRRNLTNAAAIVAVSTPRDALEEFGLCERVESVRDVLERGDGKRLAEHGEFLEKWFAITGSSGEAMARLIELENAGADGVIFAVPPGNGGAARQAKAFSKITW